MSLMADNSGLVQMFLDEKVKGRSYVEIGLKHGVDPIEVQRAVRQALSDSTVRDPEELRAILALRIEKVTEFLWKGLETGSFKHGEAILRAVEQTRDLYELIQQDRQETKFKLGEQETEVILMFAEKVVDNMREWIMGIPVGKKGQAELEHWAEKSAEAVTDAAEQIIEAQIVEDE